MGFFESLLNGVVKEIGKEIEEKLEQKDTQLKRYAKEHPNIVKSEKYQKAAAASANIQALASHIRRTAEEFAENTTGMERSPKSYSIKRNVPLRSACQTAPSEPGVYILYLHGQIMKCGVATYGQGIRWRFVQYYNLNYDDKARDGDYWSVSPQNRDSVTVAWQACPQRVCNELEYKLFQKYGKGEWAKRAPRSSATGSEWELLI